MEGRMLCQYFLNKLAVDYPASFMLIVSMNPCPCGFYNHPEKDCVCGPGIVKRYLNKISGPLMDRIDLHVEVTPVSIDKILSIERPKVSSKDIAARVVEARKIQEERKSRLSIWPRRFSTEAWIGNNK